MQNLVYQGGLSVVNVGNDGYVSDIHILVWRPQSYGFSAGRQGETGKITIG
jgi:hypothetical protein